MVKHRIRLTQVVQQTLEIVFDVEAETVDEAIASLEHADFPEGDYTTVGEDLIGYSYAPAEPAGSHGTAAAMSVRTQEEG